MPPLDDATLARLEADAKAPQMRGGMVSSALNMNEPRRLIAVGIRRGRQPWTWRTSLWRVLVGLLDGGSWQR